MLINTIALSCRRYSPKARLAPVLSSALLSTRVSEVDFGASLALLNSAASSAYKRVNDAQTTIRSTLLNTLMKRLTDKEAKRLAEHWGYIESKASDEANSQVHPTTEMVVDRERNPYSRFIEDVAITAKETHLLHEHFGELVLDLGYKRVYRTSVMSLSRTPVWEKQRILRPNRSRSIADDKIAAKNNMHLPGVLTMFHCKDGRTGIIDGQHRAAALIILAQEGHWDPYARNIMVDVFNVDGDDKEIMNLFVEINRAEPVRLIDMPTQDPTSAKLKKAIDEVVELLNEQYPSMFGGPRCRTPKLNVDKFRDELFQSQFMPRNNLRTGKQLHRALVKINNSLHRNKADQWMALIGKSTNFNLQGDEDTESLVSNSLPSSFVLAYKKARKHKFYLGLTPNWML